MAGRRGTRGSIMRDKLKKCIKGAFRVYDFLFIIAVMYAILFIYISCIIVWLLAIMFLLEHGTISASLIKTITIGVRIFSITWLILLPYGIIRIVKKYF